jgi:hypothetical protein
MHATKKRRGVNAVKEWLADRGRFLGGGTNFDFWIAARGVEPSWSRSTYKSRIARISFFS